MKGVQLGQDLGERQLKYMMISIPGSVDVFRDGAMGECGGFTLVDRQLPLLKVFHRGDDGWRGSFIRFILNDLTHIMCNLGDQMIDDTSDLSVANCMSFSG